MKTIDQLNAEQAFIDSSESRQTDKAVMTAILFHAGSADHAERIWADGLTDWSEDEIRGLLETATNNYQTHPQDLDWGDSTLAQVVQQAYPGWQFGVDPDYEAWIAQIRTTNDTNARDVDGSDADEIALFVMQGVLDNDHINNDGEPAEWPDADDAMQVYTNDNRDYDDTLIQWDEDSILAAAIHVDAMMRLNGNLK